MSLTLITALSENNVIGLKGEIPWYIPEDMKRFKELTLNHPIIMGRKTYKSLPDKFCPLLQRKNIVLSDSLNNQRGIYLARSMNEALELTEGKDTYVIGGGEIYKLFLPVADKLEITRVHRNFEGDSFFPEVNWNEWNLSNEEKGISENDIPYSFLTYLRR